MEENSNVKVGVPILLFSGKVGVPVRREVGVLIEGVSSPEIG